MTSRRPLSFVRSKFGHRLGCISKCNIMKGRLLTIRACTYREQSHLCVRTRGMTGSSWHSGSASSGENAGKVGEEYVKVDADASTNLRTITRVIPHFCCCRVTPVNSSTRLVSFGPIFAFTSRRRILSNPSGPQNSSMLIDCLVVVTTSDSSTCPLSEHFNMCEYAHQLQVIWMEKN